MIRSLPVAAPRIWNAGVSRAARAWATDLPLTRTLSYPSRPWPRSFAAQASSNPADPPVRRNIRGGVQGAEVHSVLRLRSDGTVSTENITVNDLLSMSNIHVRDLISLALKRDVETVHRRPLLILPRKEAIVIAFGPIKAIVQRDSAIFFEAGKKNVEKWVDQVSSHLLKAARIGDIAPSGIDYFELFILEEALKNLCHIYEQSVRLYRPVVESLLEGSELHLAEGVSGFVILKDSLSRLEFKISEMLNLLEGIIHDDEAMLQILLTERAAAEQRGTKLHASLHSVVELLLEDYHRNLNNTMHETRQLLRLVQSNQEIAAIALDMRRNQIIVLNVKLSIAGVSLGVCTTIAGFFGMNLEIPNAIAQLPSAFILTCTLSSMLGFAVAMHFYSSVIRPGKTQAQVARKLAEIKALQSIFDGMGRIDWATLRAQEMDCITQEDFRQMLIEAKDGREVSTLEAELLFRVIDTSGDGCLQPSELSFLQDQVLDGVRDK